MKIAPKSLEIGQKFSKIAANSAKTAAKPTEIAKNLSKDIKNSLKNLKVENIWGVGRRLKKMLNNFGIKNALELRNQNVQ